MQLAIREMQRLNGLVKIEHIAYRLNISNRELERSFKKEVGITPKQLAGIYQFQSVFRIKHTVDSLTKLALAAGYYDQSHFIREFKGIAGTSPQSFFKKEQTLTDIFIPGA